LPVYQSASHPASNGIRLRRRADLQKHGVAFEDAIKVFDDDRALASLDADPDEERFKIVGTADGRVLVMI